MKSIYVLLTVIVFYSGCSKNDQNSKTMHAPNITSRGDGQLGDCKIFDDYGYGPRLELIDFDDYLNDLAQHLFSQNSETFKGRYDSSYFCITTNPDMYLNAFAIPAYGKVSYNLATILSSESDAEVAGVLAHELAHILMDHSNDTHPQLENSPDYDAWKIAYDQEITKLQGEIAAVKSKYKSNFKVRDEILGPFLNRIDVGIREAYTAAIALHDVGLQNLSTLEIAREKSLRDFQTVKSTQEWAALPENERHKIEIDFYKSQDKILADILKTMNKNREIYRNLADLKIELDGLAVKLLRSNLHPILRQQWDNNEKTVVKANKLIAEINDKKIDSYENFMKKVSALTKTHFDLYNWQEAEADNVGLELFIRAGFDPEHYNRFEKRVMEESEYEECMKYVETGKNDPSIKPPERGYGTHPQPCYRIFDTLVLTKRDHPELRAIYDSAIIQDLFPGRLNTLKTGRP